MAIYNNPSPFIDRQPQIPNEVSQEPQIGSPDASSLPISVQLEKQQQNSQVAHEVQSEAELVDVLNILAEDFIFERIPEPLFLFFALDLDFASLCITLQGVESLYQEVKKLRTSCEELLFDLLQQNIPVETKEKQNTSQRIRSLWKTVKNKLEVCWQTGKAQELKKDIEDLDNFLTALLGKAERCLQNRSHLQTWFHKTLIREQKVDYFATCPIGNLNPNTFQFIQFLFGLMQNRLHWINAQANQWSKNLSDATNRKTIKKNTNPLIQQIEEMQKWLKTCSQMKTLNVLSEKSKITEWSISTLQNFLHCLDKIDSINFAEFKGEFDTYSQQIDQSISNFYTSILPYNKPQLQVEVYNISNCFSRHFQNFSQWIDCIRAELEGFGEYMRSYLLVLLDLQKQCNNYEPEISNSSILHFDLLNNVLIKRMHELCQVPEKERFVQLKCLLQYTLAKINPPYFSACAKKQDLSPQDLSLFFLIFPGYTKLRKEIRELDEVKATWCESTCVLWEKLKKTLDPFADSVCLYFPYVSLLLSERRSVSTSLNKAGKNFLCSSLQLYKEELRSLDLPVFLQKANALIDQSQTKGDEFVPEIKEIVKRETQKLGQLQRVLLRALPEHIKPENAQQIASQIADIHFDYIETIESPVHDLLEKRLDDEEARFLLPHHVICRYVDFFSRFRIQSVKRAPVVKTQQPKRNKKNKKSGGEDKASPKTIDVAKTPKFYDFMDFSAQDLVLESHTRANILLKEQIIFGRDNIQLYAHILREGSAISFSLTRAYLLGLYSSLLLEQSQKAYLSSLPFDQHPLFGKDPQVPTTKLRLSHHHKSLVPPDCKIEGLKVHCEIRDTDTLAAHFPFSYSRNLTSLSLQSIYFAKDEDAKKKIGFIEKISDKSHQFAFELWKPILGLEDAQVVSLTLIPHELNRPSLDPSLKEIAALIENKDALLYPLHLFNEMLCLTEKQEFSATYSLVVLSAAALFLYQCAEHIKDKNHIPQDVRPIQWLVDHINVQGISNPLVELHLTQAYFMLKQVSRYPASHEGYQADLVKDGCFLAKCKASLDAGWIDEKLDRQIERRFETRYSEALPAIEKAIAENQQKALDTAWEWIKTAKILLDVQ